LLSTKKNRLFSGEKHGVIKDKDGYHPAQYMGPGTKLDVRLPRGDKGLSEVDKISKVHDIQYSLAKDSTDLRKADERMIKNVKRSRKNKKDNYFNHAQADLIKAKVFLEDKAGLPQDFFVKLDGKSSPELKKLARKELKKLELEGYGLKGGRLNTTYQDYLNNQ